MDKVLHQDMTLTNHIRLLLHSLHQKKAEDLKQHLNILQYKAQLTMVSDVRHTE